MRTQTGVYRQRFNIEQEHAGNWYFVQDCLTQGSAEAAIAWLKEQNAGAIYRIIPATRFIPHRPNYR